MRKSETVYSCDVCGHTRKGNAWDLQCQYCGARMFVNRNCKCYGDFSTPRKCCGREQ